MADISDTLKDKVSVEDIDLEKYRAHHGANGSGAIKALFFTTYEIHFHIDNTKSSYNIEGQDMYFADWGSFSGPASTV